MGNESRVGRSRHPVSSGRGHRATTSGSAACTSFARAANLCTALAGRAIPGSSAGRARRKSARLASFLGSRREEQTKSRAMGDPGGRGGVESRPAIQIRDLERLNDPAKFEASAAARDAGGLQRSFGVAAARVAPPWRRGGAPPEGREPQPGVTPGRYCLAPRFTHLHRASQSSVSVSTRLVYRTTHPDTQSSRGNQHCTVLYTTSQSSTLPSAIQL